MKNGHYLGNARRFFETAQREFRQARLTHDDIALRQAAEKGWGAVVQATNALLAKRGVKPGAGTQRKQDALVRLAAREARIQSAHISDRYSQALLLLHARCFYDGDYSVDVLEREIRRVGDYIQDIARL